MDHRPSTGPALTCAGLVGALVSVFLPWTGTFGPLAGRTLPAAHTVLTWVLLAGAAALVLGVLSLLPRFAGRRGIHWWGAGFAVLGAAMSGWAVLTLPADRTVGPGPALAAVALLALAIGQLDIGPARPRPALAVAVATVLVLVGAGVSALVFTNNLDVDATTAAGPVPDLVGVPPDTVNVARWSGPVHLYGVGGGELVVAGESVAHGVELAGISVRDVPTGVERWHYYERGWSVQEANTTEDGRGVVVVAADSAGWQADGFDLASGAQLWSVPLPGVFDCIGGPPDTFAPIGGCAAHLAVGNGLLYTTDSHKTGFGDLVYLDGRTGRSFRVTAPAGCQFTSATVDTARVYGYQQCAGPHARVVSYDPAGRPDWSTPLALAASELPTLAAQGAVLIIEQYNGILALDAVTGTTLWHWPVAAAAAFAGSYLGDDEHTLVAVQQQQVTAVDTRTGKPRWQHEITGEFLGVPLVAGGRVYLPASTIDSFVSARCVLRDQVLVFDAGTGTQLNQTDAGSDGVRYDCGVDLITRVPGLRGFRSGPLLVLATENTVAVLGGR